MYSCAQLFMLGAPHKCHTDTLASTEGGHTRLACCPRPEARQGDPTRPTTKKGPPTAACIDPNTSMGTAWPTLTLLQMVHFTSLLVCPQLQTHASQLRQLYQYRPKHSHGNAWIKLFAHYQLSNHYSIPLSIINYH